MIVLGENKKFAAALIAPDFVFLKSWCAANEIPYSTNVEMVQNPDVLRRFDEEIKKYNALFGDYEQIKRWQLVTEEWSQSSGFLSPTLRSNEMCWESFMPERIEKLFS